MLIDLLKFNCRKVKLDDEFKVHYNEGPCDFYIKSVAANIIKGHHLKKKRLSANYVHWFI